MSTITKEFTKEQLIEKLQHRIAVAGKYPDIEGAQLDAAIFKIALASLEAEPVAWLLSGGGAKNDVRFDSSNAYADPLREVTPLYRHAQPAQTGVDDDVRNIIGLLETYEWAEHCTETVLGSRLEAEITRLVGSAQPAPVVQENSDPRDAFEAAFPMPKHAQRCGDGYAVTSYGAWTAYEFVKKWEGWNACRAAMLQGAEHVSNRDELPLGYLQGHKDGLEWAAQLAEANHPQTGDWLYDDPIALAEAIRKGPDMPELKSAFADEDDNFYSWFGRFWLENYQQNNYTTSAKQMLGTMAEFAFRAGRESATQAGNSPVIPDGWQLVPVEPTPDMREAYHQAQAEYEDADGLWCPDHQWQAMLAAAPQQERK